MPAPLQDGSQVELTSCTMKQSNNPNFVFVFRLNPLKPRTSQDQMKAVSPNPRPNHQPNIKTSPPWILTLDGWGRTVPHKPLPAFPLLWKRMAPPCSTCLVEKMVIQGSHRSGQDPHCRHGLTTRRTLRIPGTPPPTRSVRPAELELRQGTSSPRHTRSSFEGGGSVPLVEPPQQNSIVEPLLQEINATSSATNQSLCFVCDMCPTCLIHTKYQRTCCSWAVWGAETAS